MALIAGSLYIAISSWTDQYGTILEGQILLGSKLDASHESKVVPLGSSPADVHAAQVAAGLIVDNGVFKLAQG